MRLSLAGVGGGKSPISSAAAVVVAAPHRAHSARPGAAGRSMWRTRQARRPKLRFLARGYRVGRPPRRHPVSPPLCTRAPSAFVAERADREARDGGDGDDEGDAVPSRARRPSEQRLRETTSWTKSGHHWPKFIDHRPAGMCIFLRDCYRQQASSGPWACARAGSPGIVGAMLRKMRHAMLAERRGAPGHLVTFAALLRSSSRHAFGPNSRSPRAPAIPLAFSDFGAQHSARERLGQS